MHLPELRLNADRRIGTIRPLNGVNLSPDIGTPYVKEYNELHAACARMHDAPYNSAGRDLVDVSRIFPLFHLDPADPKNYRFKETDDYLKQCVEGGTPVYYRLGESIEHAPIKYRIHPPADFAKWADICAHIIMHYNEGWADGFHFGIKYWEIWNEPDAAGLWTGTQEQFAEFYITAATILKKRFPELKIGGPGHIGDDLAPVHTFLKACQKAGAPLDFYSWHCYGCNLEFFRDQVQFVRDLVDSYGYNKAELHLNDWHYAPCSWSRTPKEKKPMVYDHFMKHLDSAAFIAAVNILWQDTPLDMACHYTGVSRGFGIFDAYGGITKAYCALKAVGEMNRYPHRLEISQDPAVIALAGENDEGEIAVLMSVYPIMGSNVTLLLDFDPADVRLYSVDIANDLDQVEAKFHGNSTVVPIGGKKVTFDRRIIVPIGTKPSVQLLKFKRG